MEFAEADRLKPARVKRFLSETQRLQDRLWNMAVANARKDMNSDVAALYIDSLNEVRGSMRREWRSGFKRGFPARSGSSSIASPLSA